MGVCYRLPSQDASTDDLFCRQLGAVSGLVALVLMCAGGPQVDREPAVCPGCQEGQWDPGVHQEECGQQDEGGSPPPPLP